MMVHNITHPEYNRDGVHIGWTHLTVRDHNNCLNPEFGYQDMIQFVEDLTPHFQAGPNVRVDEGRDPFTPVGMAIPQDLFPEIDAMLEQNGYKINATNDIRHILALTASMHTIILPDMNQCSVTIDLICDYVVP